MSTITTDSNEIQPEGVEEEPPPKRSLSNVIVRSSTGLVGVAVALIIVLWGGWAFTLPLMLLAMLGAAEFYYLPQQKGLYNNLPIGLVATFVILLAFHTRQAQIGQAAVAISLILTFVLALLRTRDIQGSFQQTVNMLSGLLYVAFPMGFFIAIRQIEPMGIHWAFAVLFCTWGNDTAAYFTGRFLGKRPFFPKLSPNKTLEGAIGGLSMGVIAPTLLLLRNDMLTGGAVLMFVIATFACTTGDLFESKLKRFYGIKDSHIPGFNVLPGHGGVLDRIDGLLWVLIVFYAYFLLHGWVSPLI